MSSTRCFGSAHKTLTGKAKGRLGFGRGKIDGKGATTGLISAVGDERGSEGVVNLEPEAVDVVTGGVGSRWGVNWITGGTRAEFDTNGDGEFDEIVDIVRTGDGTGPSTV